MQTLFGFHPVVFVILVVWSMIWKGIALWRSGRNNQLVWFVALFIISALGILEIVYLAFFQKPQPEKVAVIKEEKKPAKKKKR